MWRHDVLVRVGKPQDQFPTKKEDSALLEAIKQITNQTPRPPHYCVTKIPLDDDEISQIAVSN